MRHSTKVFFTNIVINEFVKFLLALHLMAHFACLEVLLLFRKAL